MSPWLAMSQRRTAAARSILLDYVSVFPVDAFVTAVRHGDLPVVFTVLGSVVLKLLLIFATGLLFFSHIPVPEGNISLTLQDSFVNNGAQLQQISSLPHRLAIGMVLNDLPLPSGTTKEYAVQSFNSTSVPLGSVLEATVDGFSSQLNCEPASMDVNYWFLWRYYQEHRSQSLQPEVNQSIRLSAPSCQISNFTFSFHGQWSPSQKVPPDDSTQTWVIFQQGNCDSKPEGERERIVVSYGQAHVGLNSEWKNLNVSQYTRTNLTLIKSTNLICEPSYTIKKVQVKVNNTDSGITGNGMTITRIPSTSDNANRNQPIPGVRAWDMVAAQFASAKDFKTTDGGNPLGDFIDKLQNTTVHQQMVLGLSLANLTNTKGLSNNITSVLNNERALTEAATSYYSVMMAQIARRNLMTANNTKIIGTALVNEDRLIVAELSARLMEIGMAVLMVLCLSLLWVGWSSRQTLVFPRNPNSIIGVATILRNSQTLREKLRGTGHWRMQDLSEGLNGSYLSTSSGSATNPGYFIQLVETGDNKARMSQVSILSEDKTITPEWRPFPLNLIGLAVVVVSTISLMVALEVVLHYSQTHNGFGDVLLDGYTHYVWVYVPALCTVLLGLVYSSWDSTSRSFAPYAGMKRGAEFQNSVSLNFMDKLTPLTIFNSVKSKHFSVALAATAAIIASISTIIISGAFAPGSVPLSTPISLLQTSNFSSNATQLELLGREEITGQDTAGLIVHANLSYPDWTYRGLVFPSMSTEDMKKALGEVKMKAGGSGAAINAILPALKPVLTCRILSPDTLKTNLTWGPVKYGTSDIYNNTLEVEDPLDWTCANKKNRVKPAFFAQVKPNGYFGLSSSDGFDSKTGNQVCSNLLFMWGKVSTTGVEQLTAIACNETVASVRVNTTLTYPDFKFDAENPPKEMETVSANDSVYRPGLFYDEDYLVTLPTLNNDTYDAFFTAVVIGKEGVPREALGNKSRAEDVIQRIKDFHSIVRVQQLHTYSRITQNTTGGSGGSNSNQNNAPVQILSATLTNPSRLRLMQDATSTHVLVALLILMLLCVVAAFFLMDTRKVLPKNPCSIAAVSSMLADSTILNELPKGAERMTDAELARHPNHVGAKFRMGWLYDGESTEYSPMNDENGRYTIYTRDS